MEIFCRQVSLPVCHALYGGKIHPVYPGRALELPGFFIYSPATLLLLSAVVCMALILIRRANKCYSTPGRKEFVLFLYLYTAATAFDALLITGIISPKWKSAYLSVTNIQLSLLCGAFAALSTSGIVWVLPPNNARKCVWMSRIVTPIYLLVSLICISQGLGSGAGILVLVFMYLVNGAFSFLYIVTQLFKLKQIRAEIWSYGTLLTALLCLLLGAAVPFFGSQFIAVPSERYVDGTFLIHTFLFFGVIMVQKLWMTDNEHETECTTTLVIK